MFCSSSVTGTSSDDSPKGQRRSESSVTVREHGIAQTAGLIPGNDWRSLHRIFDGLHRKENRCVVAVVVIQGIVGQVRSFGTCPRG